MHRGGHLAAFSMLWTIRSTATDAAARVIYSIPLLALLHSALPALAIQCLRPLAKPRKQQRLALPLWRVRVGERAARHHRTRTNRLRRSTNQ